MIPPCVYLECRKTEWCEVLLWTNTWDVREGCESSEVTALTPAQARKLAYDLLEAADAAAMAEATGYPKTDNRRINSLDKYFRGPVGSADHLT